MMGKETKTVINTSDLQKNNGKIENSDIDHSIYRTDTPLEDPSLDRFERYTFSKRIARAIAERQNPAGMIMGINGSFGEGKTTVLNFLQKELLNYKGITVIRFNPWQYHNEGQIFKALFNIFSKAVEHSEGEDQGNSLSLMLEIYADLLIYGSNSQSGNDPLKVNNNKSFSQYNFSDLESLRNKITRELILRKRPIVLMIDDLDKLEKSQIKTVLKLVKLNAGFPYVIYVLAYDENTVIKALNEGNGNYKTETGKKLLGKIVQVSIKLPPLNRNTLQEFSFESISDLLWENNIKLDESDFKALLRVFRNGFPLKSVRVIKQFREMVSFSLPEIKDHVNITDFLLIEGVRIFYPAVYDAVKNYPYLFQDTGSDSIERSDELDRYLTEVLENLFIGITEEEKKGVMQVLSFLFPAVKSLQTGSRYDDGLEASPLSTVIKSENNISSKQYFNRYFSYFVPDKDPFEEESDNLFNLLEYEDPEIMRTKIEEFIKNTGPEKFITLLRSKIPELSEESSTLLINSIGSAGDYFENPDTLFSFLTGFDHPAVLIGELLWRISDSLKRFNIAKVLLTTTTPFAFAFESYRWMCTVENDSAKEVLFSTAAEEELGKIVAQRIKEFAERGPLYISSPDETPFLLSAWSYLSGRETTGKYLKNSFAENKDNIINFLKCYLPSGAKDPGGLQPDSALGLDHFVSISNVIEPKDVFTSLLDNLGEEFLINISGENVNAGKIAQKFAKVYKSFNFLNSAKAEPGELEYIKKEISADSRRRLTVVKKGIYKPIASTDLFAG